MIFFEKDNSCIKFPLTKKAIFIKNKYPMEIEMTGGF